MYIVNCLLNKNANSMPIDCRLMFYSEGISDGYL